MKSAAYRKHNDRTHNSSTYHKKDGTPIRAILKREADAEINEAAAQVDTTTTKAIAAAMNLFNAIDSHTTEDLMTLAREMNLNTTTDGIVVASMIDSILEQRMPEAEFVAFMAELEAELIAAN